MPPMTSVLTVVEFSRSLNNRSRIAGASGVLAVRAARAVMQSLLRHAHTDARRSGSRLWKRASSPGPRGAYAFRLSERQVVLSCDVTAPGGVYLCGGLWRKCASSLGSLAHMSFWARWCSHF